MINIQIDKKKLTSYLTRLIKYFDSKQLKTLSKIGDRNTINTLQRLNITKKTPDGSPFAPLSPKYAEWKIKKFGSANIGILSGRMRNSLGFSVMNEGKEKIINVYNVAFNSKGFPYPYVFQEGSVKQPDRPFMGFSERESNIYVDWLMEGIKNA